MIKPFETRQSLPKNEPDFCSDFDEHDELDTVDDDLSGILGFFVAISAPKNILCALLSDFAQSFLYVKMQ